MFLVVDTNILFSFFKPDSFTRELMRMLPNIGYKLVSPVFALEELVQDKERIKRYGEIDELSFTFLLSLLGKKVEVISKSEYEEFFPDAEKLLPEHPKDLPYVALALSLNCAIWSNEKRLRRQTKIDVFSTQELKSRIKFSSTSRT